ncbi:sulfurtransferase TusA [Larsenimonas rhizosphaerae]|uniref:Sulfurtransferase TusA n=1 Tax=Larsenimonas rhizosphaerae TaxID=2944682 RepID=A0AA41ZFW7_9GAMM|nr:sulfurtransferase TusA [Larsenimonas rhizosphaerae]MCM2131186.1 sulfurtransferase TusA [Larsenimonas rhizosphaerae]MCX2523891.1 sulfurtransferase TusA [Larsenimonas rhizosphaerae]
MSELPSADETLDTSGLYCPEPIMMMHNKVAEMVPGECLKVVATDPATTRDIPQFCAYLGHQLIQQETLPDSFVYYISIAGASA